MTTAPTGTDDTHAAPPDRAPPAPSPTPRRHKPDKKPGTWTHPLVYSAVRGVVAATQIAGVDNAMHAMRALGGRFANLPFNAERIERATDNLQWCFPDWEPQRVHDCAIEAYRHLFSLAVEIAAAPRLLAADAYAQHVEFADLSAGLSEILRDRPCVLVTGHAGNWEVLGTTLAILGVHINALYRPLDMKPLDDWVRRTRAARGMTLIDKFGASQRLPQLMEQKAAVGFVADQNAGIRGLFVPYFDRLASAYKAIGVTAMRFNAPVVCGQAVRLTGGNEADIPINERHPSDGRPAQLFRYRIEINDVITPEDWNHQPDPLFYITARYRLAIENMVRRNPEQYLWMHRYWKSRPKHERLRKPFPDRLKHKIAELPWIDDATLERIVERSDIDAKLNAKREAEKQARRAAKHAKRR